MKSRLACMLILFLVQTAAAGNGLGMKPISNEVSILKNYDDYQQDEGFTVQYVALNLVSIWNHSARIDFVIDYNLHDNSDDNYWEFGIGVPIWKGLSINYQRVDGTFMRAPQNQYGLRWEF